MPMEKEAFKQLLKDKVESRGIREHRWYQKFFRKELSVEQLKFWHLQQHVIVHDIGHRILAPIYNKVHVPALRVRLLEAMMEEETGCDSKTASHSELHARICMALGATREEINTVTPIPETLALRMTWDWYANQGSLLTAMAATAIAGEGQAAALFSDIGKALEAQLGITHEQNAFYWVHGEEDKAHSENAREGVALMARTDADQAAAIRAVDQSLDMQMLYLSGLYRVCVEDRKLA